MEAAQAHLYGTDKAQRQAAQADGKTVNTRVDQAAAKHNATNKAHKPALNHLGENTPTASPPPEGVTSRRNGYDAGKRGHFYLAGKRTFLFGVDIGQG